MRRISAKVISNIEIMPRVYLMWAQAPEVASAARPGQFVMVRTSHNCDPLLRRPLSIHRVNDGGDIALLYDVVGRGTRWLSQRNAGEYVDILGPMGNGFTVDSTNLLLVAGGCGIAPLVFLGDAAFSQGRRVALLRGADTAARVFPEQQLPHGTFATVVTEDGSMGLRGLATDFIADVIRQLSLQTNETCTKDNLQIFACGPNDMYRAMARNDLLAGWDIQVSLEARMGCGFGLCYGCTIRTRQGLKRVCRDGPVFRLNDLLL